MLGELAARFPVVTVTTQTTGWQGGRAQLLLAEAFVSGDGKPVPVSPDTGHIADASAAGKEFVRRLGIGAIASNVRCDPERPLNLLAAMALWAGLRIDPIELRLDVLVLKVMPVPTSMSRVPLNSVAAP
jgi:hypothetical protein